jgi:maleylacetoacetate isomerase
VKLYSYFRSSASYRVRIALNLKSVAYEIIPIHLRKDGGRHRSPEYRVINPQMRVPSLKLPTGEVIVQSLAIVGYLNELYPQPPLLPTDPVERAQARAVSQIIACDIHPLNNLSTLQYLKNEMGQEQAAIDAWYHHWVISGFEAVEKMIKPGPYAFGSLPGLGDICLIPQVFNARLLKVPLDAFPKIVAVNEACLKLPEFDKARPENQPDAE